MTQPTHDDLTAALAARVDRLERQNRWYRWATTAALVGALVISPALISDAIAGKKSDTITAKRLALMDDGGAVRVLLTSGKAGKGPSITLFDDAKKQRVIMSMKKFPMLALHGKDGKARATLSAPGGKGGHLLVNDARGKTAGTLP